VGGPEFSAPEEDALILPLKVDDIEILGPWLSIWATINFTDTSSSADSAFYEIYNHYTELSLDVHRRALKAEEAAANGSQ
jgi:hypothetical protein